MLVGDVLNEDQDDIGGAQIDLIGGHWLVAGEEPSAVQLGIIRHCVAQPWMPKLGPLPSGTRRGGPVGGRGFSPRPGGGGRGGRCTVVLVRRPLSPTAYGPFEAVN